MQLIAVVALFLITPPPFSSTMDLLTDWHRFQFRPEWLNLQVTSNWLKDILSSTTGIFRGEVPS
ncbi:hypothetical protein [Photobacterium profundum]|uniref:hypothetical protein n=1 Tax=Photobacterium profundum TaxID=74109 RepID=UPI003D0D70DE